MVRATAVMTSSRVAEFTAIFFFKRMVFGGDRPRPPGAPGGR
jgi:hypothetical protein